MKNMHIISIPICLYFFSLYSMQPDESRLIDILQPLDQEKQIKKEQALIDEEQKNAEMLLKTNIDIALGAVGKMHVLLQKMESASHIKHYFKKIYTKLCKNICLEQTVLIKFYYQHHMQYYKMPNNDLPRAHNKDFLLQGHLDRSTVLTNDIRGINKTLMHILQLKAIEYPSSDFTAQPNIQDFQTCHFDLIDQIINLSKKPLIANDAKKIVNLTITLDTMKRHYKELANYIIGLNDYQLNNPQKFNTEHKAITKKISQFIDEWFDKEKPAIEDVIKNVSQSNT